MKGLETMGLADLRKQPSTKNREVMRVHKGRVDELKIVLKRNWRRVG